MKEHMGWCPFCDYEHETECSPFSLLGKDIICKGCGKKLRVAYDSDFDEETKDSQGGFHLEKAGD